MAMIKLLDSGYWHVRFHAHCYVQWPVNESPTDQHVFGGFDDIKWLMAAKAAKLVAENREPFPSSPTPPAEPEPQKDTP